MSNDDIWFDLCLGSIEVDDDGAHRFKPVFTRLSQLSANNITSIAKYREYLHRLLDKAIDYIESSQQKHANTFSSDQGDSRDPTPGKTPS